MMTEIEDCYADMWREWGALEGQWVEGPWQIGFSW